MRWSQSVPRETFPLYTALKHFVQGVRSSHEPCHCFHAVDLVGTACVSMTPPLCTNDDMLMSTADNRTVVGAGGPRAFWGKRLGPNWCLAAWCVPLCVPLAFALPFASKRHEYLHLPRSSLPCPPLPFPNCTSEHCSFSPPLSRRPG